MRAHVGNKIKELLHKKNMSVSEFARQIGITPNWVYVMLKKELLHPKWVEIISEALDYDLFQHVYISPSNSNSSSADIQSGLEAALRENELLKKQNEEMKKEISYLKEINELLRKGKAKQG